jgi:hypothetical protein
LIDEPVYFSIGGLDLTLENSAFVLGLGSGSLAI